MTNRTVNGSNNPIITIGTDLAPAKKPRKLGNFVSWKRLYTHAARLPIRIPPNIDVWSERIPILLPTPPVGI